MYRHCTEGSACSASLCPNCLGIHCTAGHTDVVDIRDVGVGGDHEAPSMGCCRSPPNGQLDRSRGVNTSTVYGARAGWGAGRVLGEERAHLAEGSISFFLRQSIYGYQTCQSCSSKLRPCIHDLWSLKFIETGFQRYGNYANYLRLK